MKCIKVIEIKSIDDITSLIFNDGTVLNSYHDSDCCEFHYLSIKDLSLEDFDGLKFNLSNDDFFERIPNYGIALKPIKGFPVRIPGYGYNNGYYSSNLDLVITSPTGEKRTYDITDCQVIEE